MDSSAHACHLPIMPISYSVNHQDRLVRVTWTGDVDGAAFAAHLKRVFLDPEAMQYRRSLADVRGVNLLMSGWELEASFKKEAEPSLRTSVWTVAILVDSEVQFGVARQFEIFGEGFIRSAIFEDEAMALEWLRLEP